MARKRPIAVFDFETDPFLHGRIPQPFAWGFYDGCDYEYCWSADPVDCVAKLISKIKSLPYAYFIYAHNGGKFDFMYLLREFCDDARIVNGRIIEASIGAQLLRDSWAIIPMALARFTKQKIEIKIERLERAVRDSHREEILTYMKNDCVILYNAVKLSQDTFGQRLTVGGTAMKELSKFHKVEHCHKVTDKLLRPFYFGGRCQTFESGVFEGDFHMFDKNSSYPDVMKKYRHPFSAKWCDVTNRIGPRTAFALIDAINYGVLPMREPDGMGINFTTERGTFFANIHEINAGLESGRLQILKVRAAYDYAEWGTFAEFVDYWYGRRMDAKDDGLDWQVELYKLILNSAYGKFATNSANFEEFIFTDRETLIPPEVGCTRPRKEECTLCKDGECQSWLQYADNGQSILWSKPATHGMFYNIATGASITAAARAELFIGLCDATRPLYCDTDSILCEALAGDLDERRLGAWKLEKSADRVAIAGKKVYALFKDGKCVKQANKGFKGSPEQIVKIAMGESLCFKNDPPAFKLNGKAQFITRNIRRTANARAF